MGFCGFWIWFAWLGRQGFWSWFGVAVFVFLSYYRLAFFFFCWLLLLFLCYRYFIPNTCFSLIGFAFVGVIVALY